MQASLKEDLSTRNTLETVTQFNDAFNRHDVQAIMALMTDDCVFESTSPAPNGQRFVGQGPVRAVWEELFHGAPEGQFVAENIVALDSHCVVLWRYNFASGHVRGADIMRIRDGKVAEKLSYVKG